MAYRRAFDIYLDDKGYFLLKNQSGDFQRGSSQWRMTDPFTRTLSTEGRRSKQTFRFGGGAGGRDYDASDRYLYGENIDSRSGYIQIGPRWYGYPQAENGYEAEDYGEHITESYPRSTVIDPDASAAVQLDFTSSRNVRVIGFLLSSDNPSGPDWTTTHVEIWSNSSGQPGSLASGGAATVKHGIPPGNWKPWERYGLDGNAAWYEGLLSANLSLTGDEWVVIRNTSTTDTLQWLHSAPLKDPTQSPPAFPTGRLFAVGDDGVSPSWTVTDSEAEVEGNDDEPRRYPVVKVKPVGGIDGIVRKILFWGSQFGDRLLVAAGNKIFYYDEGDDEFYPIQFPAASPHSTTGFADIVVDMFPTFWGAKPGQYSTLSTRLLIGFPTEDIIAWNGNFGTTGDPIWYEVSGEVGHVFGYARNMLWKAEGSVLCGTPHLSTTPEQWDSGAHGYVIGNPNTPILNIVEGPEGQVLVLKPEGLYQIYLSTNPAYPETDSYLREDMIVDMRGEDTGRGFMRYWTDSAYFPLEYGLAEYRNLNFRDVWVRREDEGGNLVYVDAFDPYFGRYTAMAPVSKTFWLAKGAAYPDGTFQDWDIGPPMVMSTEERSRGLEIWAWDGRAFHQAVTERRYYAEPCLSMLQMSLGRGLAKIFYGHGFNVRAFTVPSWTQDKAQADAGQALNTYNPLKNGTVPQPSSWYTGGDPPHIILPTFFGEQLKEDKSWVGCEVHFDQVNKQYPVLIKVYMRYEDGQDWLELLNVTPGAILPSSPTSQDWEDFYDAWSGGSHQFKWDHSIDGTPAEIPPISKWCQLCIVFDVLTHDASEVAGAVNNIKVQAIDLIFDSHPETIAQHELLISGADHQQLHEGGLDNRTARDIKDELQSLLESRRTVVLKDAWGQSTEVRVMGVSNEPHRQEKIAPNLGEGFRIEAVIGLSLLDVTWPPPTV